MKDWHGVAHNNIDEPNTRDAIATISDYLFQLSPGIARISKGQQPNSSGQPIVNLDDYFFLPGRMGGQTGYGGTEVGDPLTLSSTKNTSKGKIYLGSAQSSAFDEVNNRIGVATVVPAGRLELRGEVDVTTLYPPTSQSSLLGYTNQSGSSTNLYFDVDDTTQNDTDYIQDNGNLSSHITFGVGNIPAQPSTALVTVNFTTRWNGSDSGTGGGQFLIQLNDGNNNTIHNTGVITLKAGGHLSGDTGFVARSFTLTPTEILSVVNWNSMTLLISEAGGGTGYSGTIYCSWVQLTVATGITTLISRAVVGQNGDLTDWLNSSGTALAFMTVAGALTTNGLTTRDPTTPAKLVTWSLSGAFAGTNTIAVSSSAARTWTLPDQTGTLANRAALLDGVNNTDTLAHTVVLGDLIHGNSTPAWASLAGNTTTTKKFLTQTGNGSISAVPGWNTIALGDLPSGTPTVTAVNLTNQSADIGATNLATTVGAYLVEAVVADTTADGAAGSITLTLSWTDDAGAQTATVTQALTALGSAIIDKPVYLASGNLTYAITHTGSYGTAKYALRIRTIALG